MFKFHNRLLLIFIFFISCDVKQKQTQLPKVQEKKEKIITETKKKEKPFLLNDSLVNKLLTQKLEARSILNEDSLDLNMLEYQLKTIPELEKVEIFVTPERELVFELTERSLNHRHEKAPALFSS